MSQSITLLERILQVDHLQARRFSKLNGDALEIAAEGIMRHLRACGNTDIEPDASAIREIIDDAINGRRVYAETNEDEYYGELRRESGFAFMHDSPGDDLGLD